MQEAGSGEGVMNLKTTYKKIENLMREFIKEEKWI